MCVIRKGMKIRPYFEEGMLRFLFITDMLAFNSISSFMLSKKIAHAMSYVEDAIKRFTMSLISKFEKIVFDGSQERKS